MQLNEGQGHSFVTCANSERDYCGVITTLLFLDVLLLMSIKCERSHSYLKHSSATWQSATLPWRNLPTLLAFSVSVLILHYKVWRDNRCWPYSLLSEHLSSGKIPDWWGDMCVLSSVPGYRTELWYRTGHVLTLPIYLTRNNSRWSINQSITKEMLNNSRWSVNGSHNQASKQSSKQAIKQASNTMPPLVGMSIPYILPECQPSLTIRVASSVHMDILLSHD